MTTSTVLGLLEKHGCDASIASEYGEPGYTKESDNMPILFADWNPLPDFIYKALERRGYSLEWSDEWIISYETDKAYRCSGNSYEWTPYYVLFNDCEIVGGDEIESDDDIQADYVENCLRNQPNRCNVFDIDLAKHGYVKQGAEFENGFHPGQTDNPADIFNLHSDKFDVIFELTGKSQFDLSFAIWLKAKSN